MPPLPSPGNVLRVSCTWNDAGSIPAGSRFFLAYTGGPPNSTDLNTLAALVASEWSSNMASVTSAHDFFTGVVIEDLSSDTGAEGTWSGSNDGDRGGDLMPANACALVNHSIARRYRGGRPRTYVRAGTQSDMSGSNEWGSTFRTAMLTAWEGWIAGILAASGLSIALTNIINVSWFSGNLVFTTPTGRARNIPQLRTGGPIKDVITASTIAVKIGSQRRRLDV